MTNGRFEKKNEKQGRMPLILALIAAAVLTVVIIIRFAGGTMQPASGMTGPHGQNASPTSGDTEVNRDPVPGGPTDASGSSTPESTDPGNVTEAPAQATVTPNGGSEQASTEPTDPPDPTELTTEPTFVIQQQKEADYEKWLSAAQIVCVSMEYPDFMLEGVYAASSTSLENKSSSKGSYIVFTSGGERMAIHSLPLEAERSQSGTTDVSTEIIGYATFDRVDPASIDLSSMEMLVVDELSELIAQSLLVSIYQR